MYHFLTDAIKRRVIKELKFCFQEFLPKHDDILDNIQTRYAFDDRAQKGIVLQYTSADPQQLTWDRFQVTVGSHVMLSNVGSKKGTSIEWVEEDPGAIKQNEGDFPSDPGIYYIELFNKETLKDEILSESEFEKAIEEEGDKDFYFFVDPVISVSDEILFPTESDQHEGKQTAQLSTPPMEDTVRIKHGNHQLVNAPKIELSADESLEVKDGFFGIPAERASVSIQSDHQGPFHIQEGQNDFIQFELNGVTVSTHIPDGFLTASEFADELTQTVQHGDYDIGYDTYQFDASNGYLTVQADHSLKWGDVEVLSDLGFNPGYVSPRLEGKFFLDKADEEKSMSLKVNGRSSTFTFDPNNLDAQKIKSVIEKQSGARVTVRRGGDYSIDHDTGEVVFHRHMRDSQTVRADYKYAEESRGPFGIDKFSSHRQALPGCVLAFGGRMQNRDRMAVTVNETRKPTAREFGGRWDLSIELDIHTRDPSTRSEIVDMIMMYFLVIRKDDLATDGIEVSSVSAGGESEEVYDETTQQYRFLGSVSLEFSTDWSFRVPLPLEVETASPHPRRWSYDNAGVEDEDLESDGTIGLSKSQKITLNRIEDAYLVGKTRDFQTIY